MTAGALLVIPLIGAFLSAAPPADQPLDVSIVDASAYPRVVVDVIAPAGHPAAELTAETIQIDGAPVESVDPIDPTTVALGLVIDDRPHVGSDVVAAEQSGSIDLVRNLADGTRVALATPSGLQSALTFDRSANIARIAGIVAGAPEVVPLPQVIVDAVTRLATSGLPDRHLVVVLGSPVELSEAQRLELADVIGRTGVRLHVVAAPGVDTSQLAALAANGTVPTAASIVGSLDLVTAAISERYRVAATLGEAAVHDVALTIDGERFVTPLEVAPQAQPVPPASTSPAAPGSVEPTPPTVAETSPATGAATPPSTALSASDADEGSGSAVVLGAGVLTLVALAAGGVWIVLRRRRAGTDEPALAPAAAASPPVPVPSPPPPPLPVPEPPLPPPPVPVPEPPPVPLPEPPPVPMPEPPPPPEPPSPEPPPPPEPPSPPAATPPRPGHPSRRREPRRPTRAPARRTAAPPEPAPVEEDRQPALAVSDQWLEAGRLRLRPSTGEVWSGNRQVHLSPAESRVLELFMRSSGDGVSAEAILAAAEGGDDDEEPVDPDVLLAQLRRKTGIRGRGPNVRKERVMLYYFGDR